jgi:hypothetical protein
VSDNQHPDTCSNRPDAEVVTPLDVEVVWRVPRSSQKKQRALGAFAPHFRVGRRVYYRRAALEQWIAQQEITSQGVDDA